MELTDYDFEELKNIIKDTYASIMGNDGGAVADYIPQLAEVNPDLLGLSFCDIYGNRFSIGDSTTAFSLQSTSKPLSYCLAREFEVTSGGATVHKHVGCEPSGRSFNDFVLDRHGLPHNPLINAGAIMVSSLIKPREEAAHRFDTVKNFIHRLGGNLPGIGFDNSIFLSEKHHADRNISLAYYMRENGAYDGYPTPSELEENIDLYFQTCAITTNCDITAVIAATLANHGVCPITDDRVIEREITKDSLSLMYMCGMYDFSGQFAFDIGLPAKSGVSGSILLCIPNIGGICIWSPRLDALGNSVRGVNFCREFTKRTNSRYHIFNSLLQLSNKSTHDSNKLPLDVVVQRCINSASQNNVAELQVVIRTLMVHHINPGEADDQVVRRILNMGDYDRRTPLHLAAAEGHVEMVEFLLKVGVHANPKDRWGNTPIHEATKGLHADEDDHLNNLSYHGTDGDDRTINKENLMLVVAFLSEAMKKQGINVNPSLPSPSLEKSSPTLPVEEVVASDDVKLVSPNGNVINAVTHKSPTGSQTRNKQKILSPSFMDNE